MAWIVDTARSRLAWVLSLFGRSDSIAPRGVNGPVTSPPRDAHALYDRLNGSPDETLELPNPRGGTVRTSVGKLSLLSADHETRKRELEAAIAAFVNDGLFTRQKLPGSDRAAMLVGNWQGNRGSLERSALLYDADDCLNFPAMLRNGALPGYTSNDPLRLPEWFPTVRLSGPLYPTPRLLDTRTYPDTVIRARFEELARAIHAHLKARNTTLRFHPGVIAAMQGHRVDVRFSNPALWYPYREWRDGNGDPEYFDAWQAMPVRIDDAPERGWIITNNALWQRSLATRQQQVSLGDPYGGTWNSVGPGIYNLGHDARMFRCQVSDALVDITRFVNLGNHLIATDAVSDAQRVLVDMQASAQVSRMLRRLAYAHTNLPMGQNVVDALAAARAERDAIYNRQRTDALGINGYVSVGDDGADITALTIDSLSLAFQGGLAAAAANPIAGVVVGIVLFVVRFGTGLIMLFTSPERPRDPTTLPFRIERGIDAPWNNPRNSIVIPCVTYEQAMRDAPFYRSAA